MKKFRFILFSLMLMVFLASKGEITHDLIAVNGVLYETSFDTETFNAEAAVVCCMSCKGSPWGEYMDITYESPDSTLFLDYVNGAPVVEVRWAAFSGCKHLKNVFFSSHLRTIEHEAFVGSNVVSVSLGSSDNLSIDESAFASCQRLEQVEGNSSLTQLGKYAFFNCPKLSKFDFNWYESNITKIEDKTFTGCSNLYTFHFPPSVTEIGVGAFLSCTNLHYVVLLDNLKTIKSFAFAECHELNNVYTSGCNALDTIGDHAFMKCVNLESANIPSTVTCIGDYAYASCSILKNANLPRGLLSIGDHAFAGCYELSSISIPDVVTTISDRAFSGAFLGIASWQFEPSVQLMEEGYYENLGSLKEITIGRSVTSIGGCAFIGQVPDTIICNAPVPPYAIGVFPEEAFNSTTLIVPLILLEDYKSAYDWKKFKNIVGIGLPGNGDVDGNGRLSINDVVTLIDKLLGTLPDPFNPVNADINGDGKLSITDVTALIDLLLNSGNN